MILKSYCSRAWNSQTAGMCIELFVGRPSLPVTVMQHLQVIVVPNGVSGPLFVDSLGEFAEFAG